MFELWPQLVARFVKSGWQALVAASAAWGWLIILALNLWPAHEAALDQLLGEGQGAVYVWCFFWDAYFAIFALFFVFGVFHDSIQHPFIMPLARWICSRYPGFEAFRAREPESASSKEYVLAIMLNFAGIATLAARFVIVRHSNWFGDSSLSPTELPWLVHPIGVILDLAIVLYLTTVLFRRYKLDAENVPIGTRSADQYVRDVNRRIFREMLPMLGLGIIVPALEVSLNLWLY